jgi:hypothetical protein
MNLIFIVSGQWKEKKYSHYLASRVPETISPEVITPEVITPDPLDFQPDMTNIDQDSQVPNRLQPVENVVSQGSQTDPSSGPKSPTKARTGEAVKKRRNPLFVDAPQTSEYVRAVGESSLHLDVKPNFKGRGPSCSSRYTIINFMIRMFVVLVISQIFGWFSKVFALLFVTRLVFNGRKV